MRLALRIAKRQHWSGFGDHHTGKFLTVFHANGQVSKCRRNRATWFQNRLDQMDFRKSATRARQIRADYATLVSNSVALDAGGLFYVEKDVPSMMCVSRTRQGKLREPTLTFRCVLVARGGT